MNSENIQKIKAAKLSVYSNSILIIVKLVIGLYTGLISIISEAIHSGLDLIASLIAYFSIKTSSKPPDKEHKYGHFKIENISGFIESLLIFVAAVWIIYEAVNKLIHPSVVKSISLGIYVMIFSAAVNFFVSRKLLKVAEKTSSIALKADAYHLLTDVYTSLGVVISLIVIIFGVKYLNTYNLYFFDPLSAIIIAVLIIKTAYNLSKESFSDLIDSSISDEDISEIENIIISNKDVISFKNLKTRKAGGKKFVEFDLIFDENISLKKAHDITDNISLKIKEKLKNSEITVHMEPCRNECIDEECRKNCSENSN